MLPSLIMSDAIKFILGDDVREVSGLPATMTLLQYLRTKEGLTGTKEGCAEGDCGACTVAVGELKDGKLSYKSACACILFLPTVDGKHILAVEHMKKDKLHPVQEAMAKDHAAQCGFCTPGFVVSLCTLLHNNENADDEAIQDAIAGNLCRCTGYKPILTAAREANQSKDRHFSCDIGKLEALQRKTMLSYEADGQKFFAPRNADELAKVLAQYPDATILSGGTDVGLWVTKQHQDLKVVIYTGAAHDLRHIRETKDGLEIGAAVAYADAFDKLAAYDESFAELLRRLGGAQIRNLGTIGGNIANGSPIGDGMPPLIALGAKIVLKSQNGSRTLNLENYFLAYKKQDRKAGEFVEKVLVPHKAKNVLFKTYKVSKRFDQDISAVCAAFAFEMDGQKIKTARIAFGGMAGTPKRASHTERFLKDKLWNEDTMGRAMAELEKDYAPLTDMRASALYRRRVASNLLCRFYHETAGGGEKTRVYGYVA